MLAKFMQNMTELGDRRKSTIVMALQVSEMMVFQQEVVANQGQGLPDSLIRLSCLHLLDVCQRLGFLLNLLLVPVLVTGMIDGAKETVCVGDDAQEIA